MNWYQNQDIIFVTDHEKHLVLRDDFQAILGARLLSPIPFHTDQFGTFTGEISRPSDLKRVLRQKVKHGLSQTNSLFGLASEGSFSNHPLIDSFATDHETLLFYDKQRELEVFHSAVTHTTSFRGQMIRKATELEDFLDAVGFPQQGVILKLEKSMKAPIFKGLNSWHELNAAWKSLEKQTASQELWIETDNRAHMNPLRRQFLQKMGFELLEKIKSPCPLCHAPGFYCQEVKKGLPCKACGSPTQNVLYEIWRCQNTSCLHHEQRQRKDGKVEEDPRYCDFCNP